MIEANAHSMAQVFRERDPSCPSLFFSEIGDCVPANAASRAEPCNVVQANVSYNVTKSLLGMSKCNVGDATR